MKKYPQKLKLMLLSFINNQTSKDINIPVVTVEPVVVVIVVVEVQLVQLTPLQFGRQLQT